jgi:hypothetical protein
VKTRIIDETEATVFVVLRCWHCFPYSQFVPFLKEHGLDLGVFFEQLFSNRISSFFGQDVIVSSMVLWTLWSLRAGAPA